MFGAPDLALRRGAAWLPPAAGYALTRALTPRLDRGRESNARAIVERNALRLLGDAASSLCAAQGFVDALACDDLDALTATLWPRRLRLATTRVEGLEALPAGGPAVVASFHLSGGFRVFDVLNAAGRRPTFLWAEDHAPNLSIYGNALRAARRRHLELVLARRWIIPGPGARDALAAHLDAAGTVVALLDVAPKQLGLRDTAAVPFFGRKVEFALGLMRLAAARDLPVVAYDGRLEGGRRVLRFHPPLRSADPLELLAGIVARLEGVVRERPWDWQGWLDLDPLIGATPELSVEQESQIASP